jgi:hypothetical protein
MHFLIRTGTRQQEKEAGEVFKKKKEQSFAMLRTTPIFSFTLIMLLASYRKNLLGFIER